MQKAGMFYEGTLRQADTNNTGVCDVSYYSVLKEEFDNSIY
jgi:RimJ/RimL family protein N-acetyltransferase